MVGVMGMGLEANLIVLHIRWSSRMSMTST